MRVYPGRQDSVGVSLRSQGQDALLKKLDAWQMQSIWPDRSVSKEPTGSPPENERLGE
jgi:hypothetical protein